eukprot:gb/GECG01015425.1/.p1 GENE.gb/GECG01015425.1/~~gb/GECG01015425.1/.p1  ORF type:complete len:718 (+),score=125.33 gb/GECG01015425.1/:1-2154(+)
MPSQKVDDLPSLPRMAPVEHRRNFHEEAASVLPSDRQIRRKDDLMSTVRSLNDEKAKRAATSTKGVSTGTLASLARANAGKDSQSNRNLVKRRGVDVQNARPLDGVEQVGQGYGPGLLPYERKPLDNTSKTIIDLENEVNSTSKKYNNMKEQTRSKMKKVEELSAQLESLRSANAQLKPEATPEMKRTNDLEEKITQRKQELAEAEFRYSQLEHMAARLKRNHITFDGHLRMMDEAIGVAEKELNDVQSNLLSLNNAKDESATTLAELEKDIERRKEERKTELGKRREELKIAKKAEGWRRYRQQVREELEAKLLGGLSKAEEQELVENSKEKEVKYEELLSMKREREQKANELYNLFTKIRHQMGIQNLDEMSQKFRSQKDSKESLEIERNEAENRLNEAKEAYKRAQTDLQAIEASGGPQDVDGNVPKSSSHEDLSQYVTVSGAREAISREIREMREQVNAKYAAIQRLSSTLVVIRQGSSGLLQTLRAFRDVVPASVFSRNAHEIPVEMDFEDIYSMGNISIKRQTEEAIQILGDIHSCVRHMKRAVQEAGAPEGPAGSEDEQGEEKDENDYVDERPLAATDLSFSMTNVRVKPRAEYPEQEPDDDMESDEGSEASESSDPYTGRRRSHHAHHHERGRDSAEADQLQRQSLKQDSSFILQQSSDEHEQSPQKTTARHHGEAKTPEKENSFSSSMFGKSGPQSPLSYLTSRPPLI